MTRFSLFDVFVDCTKCGVKTGKAASVHSWNVYCENCYDELVKSGAIIPPSHYKKVDEK
jgi:hypothetical protein